MADSQSAKKRSGYDQWSKDESDGLLELMVDAANRGWRDNSGVLTKQIVIDRILPPLNSKFKCNKTYSNYQSRLKWFKGRYTFYSTLLNFSSGFGYDSTSKKFTAPNEVWDEYIKAHPKDGYMRYEAFDDYEDLKIVVGNGVTVGKNSIGLGSSTEARTLEAGEMRDLRIEDLAFDVDSEVFVLEQNDPSPKGSPNFFEVPRKKLPTKRGRVDYEGSSDSSANPPKSDIFQQLAKLTSTFEGVYGLLEKGEQERTYTAWDAIKEVPNLGEDIRLEAFNFLDTKTKKDGFLKMTPEERANWIHNMMSKKL
ncbi:Disease resistance protein [Heracleum sosnowskyi]|uniref:Disease resistance protein n=1 Tax=Heracleum sosnowskyi TaxID=360622 RepID=A0AAD8HG39_9APIA|nr:Disease resistance protein [Heracleum sosnowskyi]